VTCWVEGIEHLLGMILKNYNRVMCIRETTKKMNVSTVIL